MDPFQDTRDARDMIYPHIPFIHTPISHNIKTTDCIGDCMHQRVKSSIYEVLRGYLKILRYIYCVSRYSLKILRYYF